MRNLIYIICAFFLVLCIYSCKTQSPIYIPVESARTEYVDRFHKDSIYLQDSIIKTIKGDTVWLEKYRYLYRDKLVRDSIFVNDSIPVPYPVIQEVEVNKPTGLQNFLAWCGGITLLAVLLFILYRVLKKKLKGTVP